ncbi:NUDIX hydrolase [Halorussus marinus]|uniref:NUDIX hydrolase n=1 Tax=Halorussus marinus TaxID=2505976 RepID=UPI0010921870|nr:NUDIX hydrolase [Halorussus marinus]
MTAVDDLWYLATRVDQRAERVYHRLTEAHEDFLERTYRRRVSRRRFRTLAERELGEEAGVDAEFDGLALSIRVDIEWEDHATGGVLPLFEARAESARPTVSDPDGEITDAGWFDELPEDTRDRADLVAWRERALE